MTFGVDDVQAVSRGGDHEPFAAHLDAIRDVVLGQIEGSLVGDSGAVFLDVKGINGPASGGVVMFRPRSDLGRDASRQRTGLGDVQSLAVGREGDPVGLLDGVVDQERGPRARVETVSGGR